MNKKTNDVKIPVIVIFAPTASGKTALTKELFSKSGSHFILNAEIISADSQAVYKDMNIGTAKPDADFCREIPHHLIDILSPDMQYNVSLFVDDADKLCEDIYRRGKIPVVCGGTGFYIRNFLYGVAQTPVSDEILRKKLKDRIEKEGNQKLYDELKTIDPESAAQIHVKDAYRICRALEVYYLSGKNRTSYKREQKLRDKYNFLFLVIEPNRDVLYQRIKKRVDVMFEQGLEKEVRSLVAKGYKKDSPGMKAIGYSEWFENGDIPAACDFESIEKIKESIKHHSCKYAKKQYTYIRHIPGSISVEFRNSSSGEAEIDYDKINMLTIDFKNKFCDNTKTL